MDENRPNFRDDAGTRGTAQLSGGITLARHALLPAPLLRYAHTCVYTQPHIANIHSRRHLARTFAGLLVAEVHLSAGIMRGFRPVEFASRVSLAVLVVTLARAAPLDAASAQRGDLVYIELADADDTATLTVQ